MHAFQSPLHFIIIVVDFSFIRLFSSSDFFREISRKKCGRQEIVLKLHSSKPTGLRRYSSKQGEVSIISCFGAVGHTHAYILEYVSCSQLILTRTFTFKSVCIFVLAGIRLCLSERNNYLNYSRNRNTCYGFDYAMYCTTLISSIFLICIHTNG